MSSAAYLVRRATVDDRANMVTLWNSMRLPAGELERRLTEFQIVEAGDGSLLGGIGMEIIERHGRIHSEAFSDFALAEVFRTQLWERLQSLAVNHGLARIWTNEAAPFWKYNGFHPAESDELKRLPPAWNLIPGDWLTMTLRDEDALRASLDMDFSRLKEKEQQETERLLNKARTLKYIAVTFIVLVVIAALALCVHVLLNLPRFRGY
jgi:N-acetylglutamate synthase-like GNAT family acetyltransferase